ncbi:MAG: ATP-binding protein [Polyangiales bacterium]
MTFSPTEARYLEAQVRQDLHRKMVFLGGPRQVGKTTLALRVLGSAEGYLNWDIAAHREAILRREFPVGKLWVFDEIHKYARWRNFLKGLYDDHAVAKRLGQAAPDILVTGSARLDLLRRGGDSLQGRYHYLRLHPLSVAELGLETQGEMEDLLRLGGFPEPYFGQSDVEARRWSRAYRERLVREDVASLTQVRELDQLELLALRLPALVASPLSLHALAEDLQVAFKTVRRWLQILDRLYALFQLPPLGGPTLRALKKAQKHYHYDWTLVQDKGPRFENFVACHLLKWVHFRVDTRGEDVQLRYFRDTDGREVDFVMLQDTKPTHLIECKWRDQAPDKGLRYLARKYPDAQAWQLSAEGQKDVLTPGGVRLAPALTFLRSLC